VSRGVWCVAWRDKLKPGYQWCATKANAMDERAASDETVCGHFVIMRCGSAKRRPTCAECKVELKRMEVGSE
jgi:hypothetical protein